MSELTCVFTTYTRYLCNTQTQKHQRTSRPLETQSGGRLKNILSTKVKVQILQRDSILLFSALQNNVKEKLVDVGS